MSIIDQDFTKKMILWTIRPLGLNTKFQENMSIT